MFIIRSQFAYCFKCIYKEQTLLTVFLQIQSRWFENSKEAWLSFVDSQLYSPTILSYFSFRLLRYFPKATGAKFIFNCPPKYETYFTRTTLRPCWNIYRLSFSCSSLAIQGWIRPGTFSGRGRKNSGEVAIGLRPKSFGPSRKAFSQGRSQPHFETNSLINTSLREERRETVLLGLLCVIARPDKSEGHKTSPAATPRLRPQMKK